MFLQQVEDFLFVLELRDYVLDEHSVLLSQRKVSLDILLEAVEVIRRKSTSYEFAHRFRSRVRTIVFSWLELSVPGDSVFRF